MKYVACAVATAVAFSSSAFSQVDQAALPSAAPPRLATQVMNEIKAGECEASVVKLASFGTRHTLSDTTSPTRGIGAARNWIKSRFEEISKAGEGRLEVRFEEFDQPKGARMPEGGHLVNVVAVLPGSMPEAAKRRYYVVGHYDSRNADPMDAKGDAPGANDDASGVAVVIELARVLADKKLDATVVFLATAGEEQGLLGAAYHASQAATRGETILGVLNNDIVGDPTGPIRLNGMPEDAGDRIRIFSEGVPRNPGAEKLAGIRNLAGESDSPSRQLARFVEHVGKWHLTGVRPMLVFRPDRFLRGGDHSAFNEAGFPAVRFTTGLENYDRQHANITDLNGSPYGDVPSFVNPEYLASVARLNGATLVHLANAPSAPPNARILTAKLETRTTLKWDASPEPDVVGYEVVWRLTTEPTWTKRRDVRDAREATIDLNKDDYFFGVRAYDKDEYRSPVAFPVAAKE